jgi:hypothetical protein
VAAAVAAAAVAAAAGKRWASDLQSGRFRRKRATEGPGARQRRKAPCYHDTTKNNVIATLFAAGESVGQTRGGAVLLVGVAYMYDERLSDHAHGKSLALRAQALRPQVQP